MQHTVFQGNFGAIPREESGAMLLNDVIPGFMARGRFYPTIAGAEEESAAEKAAREAKEKADAEKAKADEAKLGDAGKAALEREREARKAAEKELKEAQKKADDLEREKLSETDRLKKDAEDALAKVSGATAKLQKANLLLAVAGKSFTNPKAVARLLDNIEFDDNDEPKNLDSRIDAAKAEFGEELFKTGATSSATDDKDDKKGGEGGKKGDEGPDTHAGERRDGKEMTDDEKVDAYMKQNFGPLLAPDPEPAGTT
jgi:hypothetical protein